MPFLRLYFCIALFLVACQPARHLRSTHSFQKFIEAKPFYDNQFTGVSVYDMEKKQFVVQYNDQKYFTPASTTKLFTFFACLQAFGADSAVRLPALQYAVQGDSLVFRGTGYPALLNPFFADSTTLPFLKNRLEKLYFSGSNWQDEAFGEGWSWDDYSEAYSAERSALPLYGNLVTFEKNNQRKIIVLPGIFKDSMILEKPVISYYLVQRRQRANQFACLPATLPPGQPIEIPFITSHSLTARLLADTLRKPVETIWYDNKKAAWQTLSGVPADTVYRRMLQTSDNFLAEQLLLMASWKLCDGQLSTAKAIEAVTTRYLNDLSQPVRWADGSGLSRMSLFTPRSQVELLLKIHRLVAVDGAGEQRLFGLLAANGKIGAGTLEGRAAEHITFVYGKTGTLSNNVNLSGYLLTKSGKKLCFSFMNNHHLNATTDQRKEMDKILTDFYLNY